MEPANGSYFTFLQVQCRDLTIGKPPVATMPSFALMSRRRGVASNTSQTHGASRRAASAVLPARCLIPRFDGAILSQEWKEALWDKFVMAAPRSSQRGATGSSALARARRKSSNNEGLPAIGSRAGPNDRKLRSRS
ncbi:hypothetical protein [Rhodobacter viridis]|uniref:hypothetical protein n=1 Tax=Rhodobacter viridis TaxID=1054202 RepID=UPI0011B83421|nr:hypothetical protein [Rhodobacter viridis]